MKIWSIPLIYKKYINNNIGKPRVFEDIDSDFSPLVREKVISYCENKYGKENICQIMTKTYGKPKGNIRLACKYLGQQEVENKKIEDNKNIEYAIENNIDASEIRKMQSENSASYDAIDKKWIGIGNKLCKFVGNDDEISDIFSSKENLQKFIEVNSIPEKEAQAMHMAYDLGAPFRQYGEHAAGVIISKDKISDAIPLMYNDNKKNMCTQCDMVQAEAKGFLKMDFLGLNNLSIITKILRDVKENTGKADFNLQDYTYRDKLTNDKKIFEDIFQKGLTQGIFQFESPQFQKILRDLKPDNFEDIIAAVSLYRPGPMDYIPNFIENKENPETREKAYLGSDILKDILSPTYGVMVYQEQIMQIFQFGAGYSLGGADNVRRAISKKHTEDILAEKDTFIFGDEEKGIAGAIKTMNITEAQATELFNTMVKFGEYAFNKSHATAYALISMFTAYCKEYYPAEFFKESLDAMENQDDIALYQKDMENFGYSLRLPDICKSENNFTIDAKNKVIYMGLKYIKGEGDVDIKHRTYCLEEFVQKNPNISEKTIRKYASLGMFKNLWKDINRPCSSTEALKWLDDNYSNYVNLRNNLISLKNAKEDVNINNYDSINESIAQCKVNIISNKKEFVRNIKSHKILKFDSNKIQAEQELLNTIVIDENLKELSKTLINQTNDFSSLETLEDKEKALVPAIVLGASEEKKTKAKGTPYRDVYLLDKSGSIISRRFSDIPPYDVALFELHGPKNAAFFNKCLREIKTNMTLDKNYKTINKDNLSNFNENETSKLSMIHTADGTQKLVIQSDELNR